MIREPIFVDGDGGIDAFLTVKAAERYIEPVDVPECAAYDANGQILSVQPNGLTTRISMTPNPKFEPAVLNEKLREFLMHCGHSECELTSADLTALVELAARYDTK